MNRFNPTADTTTAPAAGAPAAVAQPAPFDATALGVAKNTIFGLPAATFQVGEDIFHGLTRAAASIPLTLNAASNARSGTTAATTLKIPGADASPAERATFKFLFGDKPIKDLSTQVAQNELAIKSSPFAQKYGLDQHALPLAFGGVIGDEFLNLYPGGAAEKTAVKTLLKETDETVIKNFLMKEMKVPEQVATTFAPKFAEATTEADVKQGLKSLSGATGLLHLSEKAASAAPEDMAALRKELAAQGDTEAAHATEQALGHDATATAEHAVVPEEITPKILKQAQDDWQKTYSPRYQELYNEGLKLNEKLPRASVSDKPLLQAQLDHVLSKQDAIEHEFTTRWRQEAGLPPEIPSDRGIDVRPLLNDMSRAPREAGGGPGPQKYADLSAAQELGGLLEQTLRKPRGFEQFVRDYAQKFNYDESKRGRLAGLYKRITAARSTPEQVAKIAEDYSARGQRMRAISEIAEGRYKTPASILQAMTENDQFSLRPIIADVARTVKDKVHTLDYLATPEFVLEKLGLGREAKLLQKAKDGYTQQLPKEIQKITAWREIVGKSDEASTRIFKYLDGQKGAQLEGKELQVAQEMKAYLHDWANRLGLPGDKRIAAYITHIFEPDFIAKEFDNDLARMITDKVAGSVYDPFLEKRLGAMGYKEDVWGALDAYVKRATRKINFDPALEQLKRAAGSLDVESEKYIMRLTSRVNLRPTELDTLMDNLLKNIPFIGYKLGQRPIATLSRSIRQIYYRGTLGLNVGSALRNLTQGVNTYAKLGTRYTTTGYFKIFTRMLTHNLDELYASGVLQDEFIQDRKIGVYKSALQKLDKGLFYMFEVAEKINRGAAYFGAKSKAINKGLSEPEAQEYAKRIVRETQFAFGNVDSPVFLSSDMIKTLTQLQTYNVKQVEFLVRMAKDKDFGGLARFTLGSFVMLFSIGRLFGMTPDQMIPSVGLGGSPVGNLAASIYGMLSPNQQTRDQATKDFGRNIANIIPAGAQLRKTVQGSAVVAAGKDTTPTGRTRYKVPNDLGTKLRAIIFGKSALPQAQAYYNNLGKKKLNSGNRFNQ